MSEFEVSHDQPLQGERPPAGDANAPLPWAYGTPPLQAQLRSTPDDFRVEEVLGYDADGQGEHALLWVEKRGANTDWVARELAKFAGVAPVAVGYAGMKDRHAVTRQTFSVQLAGKSDPDWSTFPHADVKVLAATRHSRKLKRGALRGNRFVLVLRQAQGDRDAAERVLQQIAQRGVPNYYGEQRFGREGGNVAQARAMFAGRRDLQQRAGCACGKGRVGYAARRRDLVAGRLAVVVWPRTFQRYAGRAAHAFGHPSVRTAVGAGRVA
jgi:tRNA pseudouridine13 synthase